MENTRVPTYPLGVDGEGSHGAGLGTLSGNHVGGFTVEVDVPPSSIIPSDSQ